MSDTKTSPKVVKSEAEWRKELTPMQYAVLREKATERPFSGEYEHEHRKGTYTCAGCGQTLFESDAKFDWNSSLPHPAQRYVPGALLSLRMPANARSVPPWRRADKASAWSTSTSACATSTS